MTIKETLRDLRSRKISCVELVSTFLDRIEEVDPTVNSFITVTKDLALDQAERVDKELVVAKDNYRIEGLYREKPLLGIPIAHKDIFSTKGVETTAGSNILRGYVPPHDATVVKRLRNAGAIMLGKLNCDAFAHGASGENSDFGPTKNPYDLQRVPGGSSSGSGVSVALQMALAATGTDTGGSLRSPASFTNTVALKPTYGRVSRYGVIAMASSLDSIGHITNTIEDSALVFQVTAGFDPHDATTVKEGAFDYLDSIDDGVVGLRIGIPKEYITSEVDPEIGDITMKAVDEYKNLGATIVDVSLPHTKYALAAYYIIVPSEVSSNLARFDGIRYGHSREKFGDEAKRRIMMGTYALSAGFYDAYYLKAQKVRTLIKEDFERVFENVDVLLAPTSPVLPPKIGENVDDPLKMYMMDALLVPVNLAGLPAISVPAGFSKDGLPVGVQLIGNYFDEKLLLRVGCSFERETKYYLQKPSKFKYRL